MKQAEIPFWRGSVDPLLTEEEHAALIRSDPPTSVLTTFGTRWGVKLTEDKSNDEAWRRLAIMRGIL